MTLEPYIRKPYLPPGTAWMLRRADFGNKWLEVKGWSIEWGDKPSAMCPVFRDSNIKDDWHWSVYSRFASSAARKEFMVCYLAEVSWKTGEGYTVTGRVRRHPNLPPEADGLIRQEHLRAKRDRWATRVKPREGGRRALKILRGLLESGALENEEAAELFRAMGEPITTTKHEPET